MRQKYITQAQYHLATYYKYKTKKSLGLLYEVLKKIFTAITYSYYYGTIECDDDIETITHTAAVDMVESILTKQEPKKINSFYLRTFVRIYMPTRKYSYTRNETALKGAVPITDFDVESEDSFQSNQLSNSYHGLLFEKNLSRLSNDGGMKEVEQSSDLTRLLSKAYNIISNECPISQLAGMIANLAITSRLARMDLSEAKKIPYSEMIVSYQIKIFDIDKDG